MDATMTAAMKRGLKAVVRDVVKEVTRDILEKSTPHTEKFLIQGLQKREDSKKAQDATAALLKWERWERMKLHLLRGEKVELEFRQELDGFLGENDRTWPKGEPILSLYNTFGL